MTRRPDDLLPLLDAAALVDRSLSTLRAWVRAGELAPYREGVANNGRVLVSRTDLLTLAAAGGLSPAPGRRAPPPTASPSPPVAPSAEARLFEELLLSHRATVAALEARCADLAAAADTWRGRAEAAEAEASALRGLLRDEAGRPLWSRLFGLPRRAALPGDGA